MGLFDDVLKHNESLFLDEISLDFDFLPMKLLHRENKHQYVAECIKPLFHGRSGRNLFVHGSPGIGKTAAVRYVLRELENSSDFYVVYVNCWKKDTSYKIITEVCQQIGYKWVHNKRTDELIKSVAEMANKKGIVICLDEVDKVKELDILYSLSEDLIKKSLILIANNSDWIINLDSRIKSRINLDSVEFEKYNYEELKDILKLRRDIAFVPNVWDFEAFSLVVDKSFEIGDLRKGLFLMKETGGVAESKGSKKIEIDYVKYAMEKIQDFKIKKIDDFNSEEQKILNLIMKNSGGTLKKIFDIYSKNGGEKSYRTFHRKLEELNNSKMIEFGEKIDNSKTVYYSKKLSDF